MSEFRVLIVEDEAVVALDLQSRLERIGCQVLAVAATGQEAISFAETIQPDLIFMDIGLKGPIDGLQAAGQIRPRMMTPIIFVTAYGDAKTRQQAAALAPVVFLTKPFADDELLLAVRDALGAPRRE